MRLIDADAAYDILTAYYHQRTEIQRKALREALDRVPTAEPCEDAVSRQAAIKARRYTFGNDEFSLENAYHDCKLVFDGITDDDSFQEADTGLILYYANEIIYALQEALEGKDTNVPSNDAISRQALIESLDAYILDETTNLNGDSVREILMDLPSVQPERKRGKWIHDGSKWKNRWICSECGHIWMFEPAAFCDKCGAEMEGAE